MQEEEEKEEEEEGVEEGCSVCGGFALFKIR